MKKSDLLNTLTRLRPFAGTTHVNRLLSATGMESLERLAEFIEACSFPEWENWLVDEIFSAEGCLPRPAVCGVAADGSIHPCENPTYFQVISAQHVGPEPSRYTISQYFQIAGNTPTLTGRYQTNPAYWNVVGHPTWEQHIAGML